MRVVTERLRLVSRSFRYKVALYLSYLHIKFDYEIKGTPFECQAYIPISPHPNSKVTLAYRFGCICIFSQISLLLRLITQIYGNERTCDK